MNLTASIAGITFPTCIMNAAGARCVTAEELEAIGNSRTGAIVTKSMTRDARDGNPSPRYVAFPHGSINSMGLPNLGHQAYVDLIPRLKEFNKPVIASVAGFSPDEFVDIATAIDAVKPDLMEINLSCPNIEGHPQIAYDFDAAEQLLTRIRKVVNRPMGTKLPPYFDPVHHDHMASILEQCRVDFISVINSIGNGLVIDPETDAVVIKPKGGFGGLGGAIIKPVALANVRAFALRFQGRIPIIGVGGIETGQDIYEHLLAGASAVQIGTAFVEEGTQMFARLEQELTTVLESKGLQSSTEAVGRLKEL
ncbi:MAG TPA: dihydroorotate oxidase [Nitrospirales bacterium]|nr:dihydroorotate oxidase [Nitrospirales bacterium]HIA13885.1 dihydroorotate oxidase [Nitrospirales bacterium]HIB54064.1 dihydroorotate oxidase [Nitrospirales bacterium]HIC04922.1 dihydroorotate oxidase [Nitrospirales bacterium]HIN32711.1 dihydroorotate oxidase [Nitrospirales bacterium]